MLSVLKTKNFRHLRSRLTLSSCANVRDNQAIGRLWSGCAQPCVFLIKFHWCGCFPCSSQFYSQGWHLVRPPTSPRGTLVRKPKHRELLSSHHDLRCRDLARKSPKSSLWNAKLPTEAFPRCVISTGNTLI